MASKIVRAIVMGAPGSGKGTISTRIVQDFGMKHLSSGDVLRKQVQQKTVNGTRAKHYMDRGELIPDTLMTGIMMYEVSTLSNENVLFDGFPRTVEQAKTLNRDEHIDIVLNLRIPFDVIIERIKGRWIHLPSGRIYNTEFNPPKVPGIDDVTGEPLVQRDDDKEETVKARLEHYRRLTHPVLLFFSNKGMVEEFKGTESNDIWPHVRKSLSGVIKPINHTKY